jgi:hypothetical protein
VPETSPLRDALTTAGPNSCLAIRGAAVHRSSELEDPLVVCDICSGRGGNTTCTPLLVGGEVIGAVLATHDAAFDEDSQRRLRESVRQAAPVFGEPAQSRGLTDLRGDGCADRTGQSPRAR